MKTEHERAIEAVKKLQRSFSNNVKITGDLAHVVLDDEEALIERYLSTMRESGYELVKLETIIKRLGGESYVSNENGTAPDLTVVPLAKAIAILRKSTEAQAITTMLKGQEDE